MKKGQEALTQYSELAEALAQLGASWIVAEVEEVISRGKTVAFRDLSEEQNALYENRRSDEARRGLAVEKAKAGDSIGVPFEPHEQLTLLVDAVERVLKTSEQSYSYVCSFAAREGVSSVRLAAPEGTYTAAGVSGWREISITAPSFVTERLAVLHQILRSEVLG